MNNPFWLIIAAGLGTFLMRFIPLHRAQKAAREQTEPRWWESFFVSIGPAAIASLLVASVAPDLLTGTNRHAMAVAAGLCAVVAAKKWLGGFAVATLAGALTYGLARASLGG
jgi:branched-subunit amino acid transport protein